MKKYVAEFIGTFMLVFCGAGAIVMDQETHGGVGHAGIAITFGLIVISMIYTLGSISGCHINPAVTVAFTVAGRFNRKEVLPYIFSQFAGAICASLVLKGLFVSNEFLGATMPAGSAIQSLILETILSFILMFVILHAASGSKEQGMFAAMAIGFIVLIEAMFAGPISGASMNPARSFGPAIVAGHYKDLWVYFAGPILGMCLSVPVWKYLTIKKIDDENRIV